MVAKNLRKILNPAFIISPAPLKNSPDRSGVEYGIIDRSDVGNSSFINHLLKPQGRVNPSCSGNDDLRSNHRNEGPFDFIRPVDPRHLYIQVHPGAARRWREQLVGG
jgi:hypothetical protein